MTEQLSPTSPTELATEPVSVNLGDGVTRHLRYSLASMKRLRKKFGVSLMSPEALRALDEDKLGELIYEGLVDKTNLTIDDMAELLDARYIPSVVEKFSLAFSASLPSKNVESQPETLPLAAA